MDLWYSELHTKNVKMSIKIREHIHSEESRFQKIDVFDSIEFGKFLTLDGFLQFTEKDEFIYHEMIAHVPMATHPNPQNILVVGAGNGGVLGEILKYPSVQNIDLVEIDQQIVEVCKKHMPRNTAYFDHERVNVIFQNGLKYVRNCENKYDVIVVDTTDPFGPGEALFTKEFYGSCYKALKEDGIMVNQHESPFYTDDANVMKRAHNRIVKTFPISKVYQAHIPTYPSGHWLFGFASKKYHPIKDMKVLPWKYLNIETKYYNTNLHKGAFYLPTYVECMLMECEKGEDEYVR